MLRKSISFIALSLMQSNFQFKNIAKTCLPASMLTSSSKVYVQVCPAAQIFSKQQMSPSESSSCCFCHIFSCYFAQFQPLLSLLKRVKCPSFLFHNRNNSASSPGLLGKGALTYSRGCIVIITIITIYYHFLAFFVSRYQFIFWHCHRFLLICFR